jgi:hypothetical protein
MKPVLLLLLALLLKLPTGGPPKVRVTFNSLTKAVYLAAKKTAVATKPETTFPLKKAHGKIVVPLLTGNKTFRDKLIGTDDTEQAQFEYLGYLPQFSSHLILGHFWERTQWLIVPKVGQQLELYNEPNYSPDLKYFVVISAGVEDAVYPNSIQLFQLKNSKWREVWKLEPPTDESATWEPNEVHWISNNVLILKKRMWTGKNPGNIYTYTKLTIK